MEAHISRTLCLLYQCVEIIYRLSTFAAMFLVTGAYGLIFIACVILLRFRVVIIGDGSRSQRDDKVSFRLKMTKTIILTITDSLVHSVDDKPLFKGSTKILTWHVVRMAPHIEAFIAFGTLFWHPWGQEVLRSRRLALLFSALAAMAVKEMLQYDRNDEDRLLNGMVKEIEDKVWRAFESCYGSTNYTLPRKANAENDGDAPNTPTANTLMTGDDAL
jgi:hypothetical protein